MRFACCSRSHCLRKEENLKTPSEADTQNYEVDSLVFQVCRLQQLGTVHDPTLQKEPPRCFESDIPEFFTQTARWVILVVRSPQAIYFSILAHNQGLSPNATPFTVAGGACLW